MSHNLDWVRNIYNDAIRKRQELDLTDGLEIFCSPIIFKPKVLFIGDNPGGSKGNISQGPPNVHDYVVDDNYLMAERMKSIFHSGFLTSILKDSVKINRVFFQSPDIDSLASRGLWKVLEKWCLPYVATIIDHIEPEVIFAESMGCYKSLIYGLKGKFGEPLVVLDGKIFLQYGTLKSKVILGINHPSSKWTRGITDEQWGTVSNKLEEVFRKKF